MGAKITEWKGAFQMPPTSYNLKISVLWQDLLRRKKGRLCECAPIFGSPQSTPNENDSTIVLENFTVPVNYGALQLQKT